MMRLFFHLIPALTFYWDNFVTMGAAFVIASFSLSYDRVAKILGEPVPERSCEYEISSQVCIAGVLLGVGLLLKIRWHYFTALAIQGPVCYAVFGSIFGCLGCDSGDVSLFTGTLQLVGLGVLTLVGVVLHERDRRRMWESWCDAETLMTRLQTAHSLRERLLRAVFDVSFAAELEPESGDLRVVGEWPALDSFLGMPMKDMKLSGYLPGVDTARFFDYVRGAVVATDEAIPACLMQVSFETASGCSIPANMYVVSTALDPVLTVCLSTKILADEEVSGHHRGVQPTLGVDLSGAALSCMQNLRAESKLPLAQHAPPSLHSAPTELLGASSPRVLSACEAGDDCLRPDSMAWVEGFPLPQPLTSLRAGQKILCHDSLSKGLKYAEILSLRKEMGATDWVTVSLEDGTSLQMTANHPVQPLLGKGPPGAVRAKDLRPGNDHLMVLKTLPILVQEVSSVCKNAPENRMFLTLRQPERHSPFIASSAADSQGPTTIHTIAVGSADAPSREYDMTLKNTFINIVDSSNDRPIFKRSNSAPPGCSNLKVASTISTKSVTSTSIRSSASDSGSDANILLAPPEQPFWTTDGKKTTLGCRSRATATEISLSEVLSIRSANMLSLGAATHGQGDCKACLFANRASHNDGMVCWKGVFCERCHEAHAPIPRKKPKTGRQREFERRRLCLTNGDTPSKPVQLMDL
jgi:hypothetical protein